MKKEKRKIIFVMSEDEAFFPKEQIKRVINHKSFKDFIVKIINPVQKTAIEILEEIRAIEDKNTVVLYNHEELNKIIYPGLKGVRCPVINLRDIAYGIHCATIGNCIKENGWDYNYLKFQLLIGAIAGLNGVKVDTTPMGISKKNPQWEE